jgi:hypothetical protein
LPGRQIISNSDTPTASSPERLQKTFARKLRQAQLSEQIERAVPGIASFGGGAIVLASMWEAIPDAYKPLVSAGVVAGSLASAVLVSHKNPFSVSRNEGARRLDQTLNDPNMPAQMLLSEIPGSASDLEKINWTIYKENVLLPKVANTRVSAPKPDLARSFLSAGATTTLTLAASMVAIDNAPVLPQPAPPPEVVAWIEWPKAIADKKYSLPQPKNNELLTTKPVHQTATLHLSVIGSRPNVTLNGQRLEVTKELRGESDIITYEYQRQPLQKSSYILRVGKDYAWQIPVNEDKAPKVLITGVETTEQGHLLPSCIAKDDFGLQEGHVRFLHRNAHPQNAAPEQARLPEITIPGSEFCAPEQ